MSFIHPTYFLLVAKRPKKWHKLHVKIFSATVIFGRKLLYVLLRWVSALYFILDVYKKLLNFNIFKNLNLMPVVSILA